MSLLCRIYFILCFFTSAINCHARESYSLFFWTQPAWYHVLIVHLNFEIRSEFFFFSDQSIVLVNTNRMRCSNINVNFDLIKNWSSMGFEPTTMSFNLEWITWLSFRNESLKNVWIDQQLAFFSTIGMRCSNINFDLKKKKVERQRDWNPRWFLKKWRNDSGVDCVNCRHIGLEDEIFLNVNKQTNIKKKRGKKIDHRQKDNISSGRLTLSNRR